MAREKLARLTPVEAQIMDCVWQLERATVRQVQDALSPEKDSAYNSVLTVMRILRDKGFLTSEREGRTDVYRATVSRERMGRRGLTELLDRFFSGSPQRLVSQLLDSEEVDLEEVLAIRKEIDRKLRER